MKTFSAVVLLLGVCLFPLATSDSLNFVVLGDWGGQGSHPYYTEAEKDIADVMGKKAAEIGSQFTVALGDNFYTYGVKDVDDSRFQDTYENVFTADSLQSRWYVVCGNHDHYGNASAEVAYTQRSKRWYMPDFYYTETVKVPGTSMSVQFVFIDTVILSGLTDIAVRGLPPSGPRSPTQASQQWAWINDTLAASTADWIIVSGHYPVWSVAEHGPTKDLVQKLRPMLIRYNVSAYLCGHDHNLQHIQENEDQVSYFVIGAGHLTDPSESHKSDVPAGSLKFHYGLSDSNDSKGGFATMSVSETTMTLTFFDDKGNQLYSTSRPKIR